MYVLFGRYPAPPPFPRTQTHLSNTLTSFHSCRLNQRTRPHHLADLRTGTLSFELPSPGDSVDDGE
jgi:hypothetical protein